MRQFLWVGFLLGLAALAAGLALSLGTGLVGGGWYEAPEAWIRTGLTIIVVGLAVVHLSAPPVIFSSIRPVSRTATILLTAAVSVVPIALLAITGPELAPYGWIALTLGWIVAAGLTLARSGPRVTPLPAGLVLSLTILALFLLALWWVFSHAGIGVSNPIPGPPLLYVTDAVSHLYYSLEGAMILPALPTLALVALAFAAEWRWRRLPVLEREISGVRAVVLALFAPVALATIVLIIGAIRWLIWPA